LHVLMGRVWKPYCLNFTQVHKGPAR
jgi:hypothetical protein